MGPQGVDELNTLGGSLPAMHELPGMDEFRTCLKIQFRSPGRYLPLRTNS